MVKYLVLFTICITPLYSDLNKELNDFYSNLGSVANVTDGEIYNGQRAGYMTGGGISVRNRVMNSKIATVSLPKFDAGCGGIDIYKGGFSFINDKQLVETLKLIGSNAAGYAFLLGIESASPQATNAIKQFQSWANTINSLNINSCEIGSQMVSAIWPRHTQASQHICRNISGQSGLFRDAAYTRHKCAQQDEFENTMGSLQSDPKYKDFLLEEFNIAWAAIKNHSLFKNNQELGEFFMSLMGTLVVRKDSDLLIETFPSKITDESFLKIIMEGGSAMVYSCDTKEKCLLVTEKSIDIKPEQAWMGKVRSLLLSMQMKILSDDGNLSEDEKELLNKSSLPLFKIVNVLTAYKKGHCPVDLIQIADIVAMDLLIRYLTEVVNIVREGTLQLRKSQFYAEAIDDYLSEIDRIERTIRHYETRSMNLFEKEFQMMQKIHLLEEQIASEIII